mmetsp:Transcript_13348/g.20128  ORF Transcript_13348/g.20128 Transcript_13348/m.20128 type:complete len:233 (-) Transcript_13348:43-741(-)
MTARRKKPKHHHGRTIQNNNQQQNNNKTKETREEANRRKQQQKNKFYMEKPKSLFGPQVTLEITSEIMNKWIEEEGERYTKTQRVGEEERIAERIKKERERARRPTQPWNKKKTIKVVTAGILTIGIIFFILIQLSNSKFFNASPFENYDYYGVLNVAKDATPRQIKSAYRKMTLKYHPDTNPNCKDCVQKMSDVNEAYKILMDNEARDFHDRTGAKVPENLLKKIKEQANQ